MSKVIELHKGQPRALFTHTDLDGLGCAIIYGKCFPEVEVYFLDHIGNSIDDAIMSFISQDFTTPIMISDLSVGPDLAEVLNQRGNVELIDHHPSAKWLAEQYEWAFVDPAQSATYWMFDIMSQKFNIMDYAPLAAAANDYDTWGHGTEPKEEGRTLTRLLHLYGQERFYKRFLLMPDIDLSPTELAIVQLDIEHEQEYIRQSLDIVSVLQDSQGNNYALLATDRYISVVGHEILRAIPEIEYVIMIDFRKDKAQLRGRGNVDLGAMAKELGGGGHKKAAGFPLSHAAVKMFLSCGDHCTVTESLLDKIHELESALYNNEKERLQ